MKKGFLALLIVCCGFFTINPACAKRPKVYTPTDQYKYEQKQLRQEEIQKYQRSLLPKSGYATVEEYEELSRDISNEEIKIPPPELPKDIKMKYVPQPIYKLVRYNNPPGSVELNLKRKFKYDRQENCASITSPNKDILVYPVVYYYANNQCTAGDLFVIPLDTSLPDVERIMRANIIKRNPQPILSTEKEISTKFTFRTMTPVDFSSDGTKLLAKEKIGNVDDGIWKTNIWIYDFDTNQARRLKEVREAIKFYWRKTEGILLDEKRWDMLPLGFSAEDPNRIIVSAMGYTGGKPKFLGNWSIDIQGERTQLISVLEAETNVSISGYKLVQDGVINPTQVYNDEKRTNKLVKKKRKVEKKQIKKEKKQKKHVLKKKLKEMKKESKSVVKSYNKSMRKTGPTAVESEVAE